MALTTSTPQQQLLNELHRHLMVLVISHYHWKSLARHQAFGETYHKLIALADPITEQLIGYSKSYPSSLVIGTVEAEEPQKVAQSLIDLAKRLKKFAEEKEYCGVENLADELSGLGAQLQFLSVFP